MTSSTEVAVAIGSVSAAIVAAIGLGVSLRINWLDRRRADQQTKEDRQAAFDLALNDRAAAREDAERRHIVDLLLELGRQIGDYGAYSGAPQSAAAAQRITLLLHALPSECAQSARKTFGCVRPFRWAGAVGEKTAHLGLNAIAGAVSPPDMQREVAYDIDRYLTSGVAPSDVWSDLDDLKRWQRENQPR